MLLTSKVNRKVVVENIKKKKCVVHQFEKPIISILSERKRNRHDPIHKLLYL